MGIKLKATRVEIDWHPGLSIYASEAFLKAVGDECGWIGGIDASGKLRCVLPYTIIRKGIIRMVRFRVETIPIGAELGLEDEKSFLNSVIEYVRGIGADMIIPATTNTIFRTYPEGAIAAPYSSYIMQLGEPESTLWHNVNETYRKNIRSAIKKGVQIKSGIEHIDAAYEIIKNTFKRSRLGFMAYSSFKNLILSLGENVKILVADYNGIPQSCTVFPFSGYCAYALYGGSIEKPASGAMKLLQWEAIRLFRELGVKRYDFVGARVDPERGSKQEGIMLFKQYFGAQMVRGYIWKYSIHPLQYATYSMAVRLLRGGDIVDAEHHKLQI